MSYATGTTHYNLPQTVGTDKRDWFDTNQAFADIDSALYGVVQQSATDHNDIANIKATVALLEAADVQFQHDLNETNGRVTTLEQNAVTDEDAIDDLADMFCPLEVTTAQSDIEVASGRMFRYNGVLYVATTAIHIGDTIVPNTNCVATNMETELSDLTQPYSNLDIYVAGDGVATYSNKLDSLFALIDTSKLTANSKLVLDIPSVFGGTSLISFTSSNISAHLVASGHIDEYNVKATSSTFTRFTFSDASVADKSSDVLASGAKIGIIY